MGVRLIPSGFTALISEKHLLDFSFIRTVHQECFIHMINIRELVRASYQRAANTGLLAKDWFYCKTNEYFSTFFLASISDKSRRENSTPFPLAKIRYFNEL